MRDPTKKFGPDRFSRLLDTNKQTDTQSIYRKKKKSKIIITRNEKRGKKRCINIIKEIY